MYRRIIPLLLCAALFGGCFKSVSYDTNYVVKSWVQPQNQGALISLDGAKAYAFAVDTTIWTVASYADALKGILTRKSVPDEQFSTPLAVGEPFAPIDTIPNSVNWLQMSISTPSVMVVVVDPEDSVYAYTQQSFFENLSPYYVSVTFQPWRDRTNFTNGAWVYVNEFYDPDAPKTADFLLKPKLQLKDGANETPLSGLDLYAFAADTAKWYVRSYADAKARILTSKTNPEIRQTDPKYVGIPDRVGHRDGWRRLTVRDTILMVVAVSPEQEAYAYRKLTLSLGSPETGDQLTFRTWKTDSIYIDNKEWRVLLPAQKTVNPENSRR